MVTDIIRFIDELIRFWSFYKSKVKVTAGNDPKNRVGEYSIFVTIGANFTKIRA